MVKCEDCDYRYETDGVSTCHRFPPKCILTNPHTTGHIAMWPTVKADGEDEWCCGEGAEA